VLQRLVAGFQVQGGPPDTLRTEVRAELPALLQHWLREHDRAGPLPAGAPCNDMQAYGMGVCALLHYADASELHTFEAKRELREWHDRVCVCDTAWPALTWRGLHHIVLSLQLEFEHMFQTRGGARCLLPLDRILLCLMQRIGFLLCHDYKHEEALDTTAAADHDVDNVQLLVDVDAQGWRTPRPEAVRQLLLAVHALLSAYCLLMHSTHVRTQHDFSTQTDTAVHDFHRESAMDDFYELHMIATVPVGSIVQYKDKFRHLFHSVSQVVYFHYPAYQRTKQLTLEELRQDNTPAHHLLPLLQQLHPSVPVLYEHTGAGLRAAHERHPFAWVVLGAFVVLVDGGMQSYCGDDLRALLGLLEAR
jgi:hypothetical protein